MNGDQVLVELRPLGAIAELAAEWRMLERESDASAFTSWMWIGSWLESLPDTVRPQVLRVTCNGRLDGLGVLTARSSWRNGLRVRRLHLHATGVAELDMIKIECNGLLVRRSRERATVGAALAHLCHDGSVPAWDELVIPGIDEIADVTAAAAAEQLAVSFDAVPSHAIDLEALTAAGKTFLEGLPSKTRRKIRTAARDYVAAYGPLRADVADTLEQAQEFFNGLGELHQAYWRAKGLPGAFANRFFVDFHRRIIDATHAAGGTRIARVCAGDTVLGYLYFLVKGNTLYFYQSGYRYGLIPQHDIPGFVCIAETAEAMRMGEYQRFEHLAGRHQYKSELANACRDRYWLVLQRPRIKLLVERKLRALRRRWRDRHQITVGQLDAGPQSAKSP